MSKANDMKLPEGKMCRDCLNYRPCANLFKCKKDNTTCDWSPSRFDEIPIPPERKLKQAEEALAKSEEGVAAQSERIISLENEVRTKEEALKVAREALTAAEWGAHDEGGYRYCPVCHGFESVEGVTPTMRGHKGCILPKAITKINSILKE